MKISFHTDAFNSAVFSFEKTLQWAQKNDVHYIESGLIEGVSWIHGLGYFPHISLSEDPLRVRETMERYGVRFSQLDAAYPLSGEEGLYFGVPYVLKALPWAKLANCPNLATTDGLKKPEGMAEGEALELMKRAYGTIVESAERYEITVNIEVHGYFTTNPDLLEKMLHFTSSPYFGLNFDTGNSFIAGRDPVSFCRRFLPYIRHVHVKDVSPSLAQALRGKDTGIGISHSALGEGVNAENIRTILTLLKDAGYQGFLGIECEGQGGPLIEKSLFWLRRTLSELQIPEDKS
ncbi:MAG: sugar phosphate isomerase/epimerase family protein [Candidatus Caldatribacteriaceae bacterium]